MNEFRQPHFAKKVLERDRLIAALVLDRERGWSFKIAGPESAVDAVRPAFLNFLDSVTFGDDPPLKWTLPAGWKEGPPSNVRFATIETTQKDVDVSVFELGKEGTAPLPNVNRWRGQLGLDPIGPEELDATTKKLVIDKQPATLVDVVGRLKRGMPPMAQAPPNQQNQPKKRPGGQGKITYSLPEGWTKVAPKNAIIREQFDVVDGKDRAEATIVVLPQGAGGEMANLLRWRDQLKLPKVNDPEQLRKDFTIIDTKSGPALLCDLTNPQLAGDNRILGLILPRDDTYFLKLIGPGDLVGRHKERFQAFAKSMSIE